MKTLIYCPITILTLMVAVAVSSAQKGDQLQLVRIVHQTINNSPVSPDRAEVGPQNGFIEAAIPYAGNCREQYRFEYQFDQDMGSIKAGQEYGFSYSAKIVGKKCNDNRSPRISPGASNGGWSALVGGLELGPWNKLLGMPSSDRFRYAKDNGRPNVYLTGTGRGVFTASPGPDGYYSWVKFDIEGASNLPGQGFFYEILFVYQVSNRPTATAGNCPPPDCSGFPGTVPVWNFESGQGECWCPEGTRWDKADRKCVAAGRY